MQVEQEIQEHFFPKVEMKDCNVTIDGRMDTIFDRSIKNNLRTCDNI